MTTKKPLVILSDNSDRRQDVAVTAEPGPTAADLARGLARGEIVPFFQPIIDLSTRELAGFEALARWHHPRHGLIPPALFVPLAEECGLIDALGGTILNQACAFAASYRAPVTMSVNVSPHQLLDPAFPSVVDAALAGSGLDPARLELEITETALIAELETAKRRLADLKALGGTISLDDFGTGYSGLAHLAAFPFDKLKIDRTFVGSMRSNASSMAIVQAVLGLARVMGLKSTAEGIDASQDMDFLRAQGCHLGQGFGFGRPLPAEETRRRWYPAGLVGDLMPSSLPPAEAGPGGGQQRLARLVYVSRRNPDVSDEAIGHILAQAQVNNARDGISGALLLVDDVFIQYLEGDADAVSKTFVRIAADARHRHVRLVGCLDAGERLFEHWSMGDLRTTTGLAASFHRYAPTLLDDPVNLTAAHAFAVFEHVARSVRAGMDARTGMEQPRPPTLTLSARRR